MNKVKTSSEREGEPSFTFSFLLENNVHGLADAFNDENYYMFEIDFYFERGKIEFLKSGDEISYYRVAHHPLFSGFRSLHLERTESSLLSNSNLARSMEHISNVIKGSEEPMCTLQDGVAPLFIANALIRSYQNNGTKEKVGVHYV
jgi:hypothetical protein